MILWLLFIIVGVINFVFLLFKVMEFIGLGYMGWFVYCYLFFKFSWKEFVDDIEELKGKIIGVVNEVVGK